MRKAYLSSCLWVPSEYVRRDHIKGFTVKATDLNGEETTVFAYRTDRPGYVGFPRVAGLKTFANIQYEDRTTYPTVKYPKQVALRDYQVPVIEQALSEIESGNLDFIIKAATGKGKTVMGLALAARLGVPVTVLVDQEYLQDQWVSRAKEHLGLTDKQIGIVRADKADFEGKLVTICMIQTLARRGKIPAALAESSGLVLFDEVQVCGAATFSRASMMFDAAIRVGVSATPKRKDTLQKLIDWNIGSVRVVLEEKHARSNVYILRSYGVYSWYANKTKTTGRFLAETTEDGARNLLVAEAAKWLYETGRDILVISDRIEQLQSLHSLLVALGVPEHDVAMCAKSSMVYRYAKDPTPARRPPHLEKNCDYTPVHLTWVQKTIPKKERTARMARSGIILSTYGIMAKGVDIQRLSGGIDASPRSESTQVLGRTLRTALNKLIPIWITVADMCSYRSIYQLCKRLQGYEESNAEVFIWDETSNRRRRIDYPTLEGWLVEEMRALRKCKIVQRPDGNNVLM